MAIFRRIFRKQYKKISARYKNIKKKFTFFKQPKITVSNTRKLNLLKKKPLSILNWNLLASDERRSTEISAVGKDISVFSKRYSLATPTEQSAPAPFQAYLPKEVWSKMTKQQRSEHLFTRHQLTKAGVVLGIEPKAPRKKNSKIYFTNPNKRPILKVLNKKQRLTYLRALANRAKLQVNEKEYSICIKNPHKKSCSAPLHVINFTNKINKNSKKTFPPLIRLVPKKLPRKNAFYR